MDLYRALFGRKASSGSPDPVKQDANRTIDSPEHVATRIAHCDVCCQDRAGMVDKNGYYFTAVIGTSCDDARDNIGKWLIASCEACDQDICGTCADWKVQDPESSLFGGKVYKPSCPKCGVFLVGKTAADIKRFQKGVARVFELRPNESIVLAQRLWRVLEESGPELTAIIGEPLCQAMRKRMLALIHNRPSNPSNAERLAQAKQLMEFLHSEVLGESTCNVDPRPEHTADNVQALRCLKALREVDVRFDDRARRYPGIRLFADALNVEATIDFALAKRERAALKAVLCEQAGVVADNIEAFRSGTLSSREFNQLLLEGATTNGVDLTSVRNFERYAEYERLVCEAKLRDLRAEWPSFEAELIRDLES